MSQFWHAHWAEDAFKPVRLGNWQVPNWHPRFPCGGHCVTTTFLADTSGRLLPDRPRSKRSPWGDFKGTWELPLKIDRKLARILSAPPRYKLAAWETHEARHRAACGKPSASPRKMEKKAPAKRAKPQKPTKIENLSDKVRKTEAKANRVKEGSPESPKKREKKTTNKKVLKNEDREERHEDEVIGGQDQREDLDIHQKDIHQKDHDIHRKDFDQNHRDAREWKIIQEQRMKKFAQEDHKERKNSRCFCRNLYKTDSLPSTRVAPKPERKNICTVHQRLRV